MPSTSRPPSPEPLSPPGLACSWTTGGVDAGWVRLVGELDFATVSQLAATLCAAQARARLVVLDLRDLSFMDSAGARTIAAASRQARENGVRLVVVRARRPVARVFALADMAASVEIVEGRSLPLTNSPPDLISPVGEATP